MLYRNDNCTLYHSTCSLLLLYSTTAFSLLCCCQLWQQHNSVPDCVLPHCDHCGQVAIAIITPVSSIVLSGAVAVASNHPVHVTPLFSIVLCHPLITGTIVDMSPSSLSCLCHCCFVTVTPAHFQGMSLWRMWVWIVMDWVDWACWMWCVVWHVGSSAS